MGATLAAGETAELDARSGAPRLSGRDRRARSRSTASAPSRATASPITGEEKVTIKALEDAEIVLVDAR